MAKIGYARVSSLEQARDSSALEQQQERLRQAGAVAIYSDIQSGTRDDRPELKKALAALSPDDTLIATRLDRITRSPAYNEKLLGHFAADNTPNLQLLDDGLDAGTVAGRLTARLLAAVNAGEVERMAERVAHGRAHRQSKGGHGAKPPWGFIRAADGLGLAVDPALQPITSATIHHFLRSNSVRATCTWLGREHGIRKSKSSLTRWLKNPAIAGGIGRCKGKFVRDPDGTRRRLPPPPGHYDSIEWDRHTGLIDRSQWTAIQRCFRLQAERSAASHRPSTSRRWFTGRIKCGGCGGTLAVHFQRMRCTVPACDQRYGAGSVSTAIAKASLIRGLEFMGTGLAHRLAPLQAAATEASATPPEVMQLQEEISALSNISGTEALIQQKQRQIESLLQAAHGSTITTAQALDALLPRLQHPWRLDDDALLEVADDAELVMQADRNWIISIESKRFDCVWQFNPTTKQEQFCFKDSPELLGLEQFQPLATINGTGFTRTDAWWAAVDDERDDLAAR